MRPGDPDGHGRFARLDLDDDGRLVCHECGRSYLHLATHVAGAHGMTAAAYRSAHGLSPARGLVAPVVRDRMATSWRRNASLHEASLAATRDPVRARRVQAAAADGGWSAETRERRMAANRARRGRVLSAQEVAELDACGVDLQAWSDVARRLLADDRVSIRSLADAADITPASAGQRLKRYPARASRSRK